MKNKDDIKSTLRIYLNELVAINSSLEIYISMKHNKDWIKIYKISPTYFKLVRKSLIENNLISLSRFFDKKRRDGCEYSLESYIPILKENYNKNIDITNVIEEFEKCIIENEPFIKNLKVWRDKVLAHSDEEYYIDKSELASDAPISIEALKSLIASVFEFINCIYSNFGNSMACDKYTEYEDYKNLLNLVNK